MTDTDSLNKKEKQTGTSPIFAVVGGDAVSVTEKTSIPTVMKQIKDDATGVEWHDKADSQMGQTVQYKLTGTVANNVDTFGTYYYEFYDELSAGLTVDESSVKAVIGETPITPTSVTVSNPDSNGKTVLSVKFDDLKAAAGAAGVTVDENTRVVVRYSAKLDPKMSQHVVVGGTGNSNTVKLIYSNNPGHDTKGESVPDTVRDYTYALKLVKKDATDENKTLTGVRFTIPTILHPRTCMSRVMAPSIIGVMSSRPPTPARLTSRASMPAPTPSRKPIRSPATTPSPISPSPSKPLASTKQRVWEKTSSRSRRAPRVPIWSRLTRPTRTTVLLF